MVATRIALVRYGNAEARRRDDIFASGFASLARALIDTGFDVASILYHEELVDTVRAELLACRMALVWVNPLDGGNRRVLDSLLREVAEAGVIVSAHPDTIRKLGTKDVIFDTRSLGWGCDTHRYNSVGDLHRELPKRLRAHRPRVLKQHRGNGGDGVWKVSAVDDAAETLRIRHARRGSDEEIIPFPEFERRMAPYFIAGGHLIDQAWQDRLDEGTVRCYLVRGDVAGFGIQEINALHPAPLGRPASEAPPPSQRHYHGPERDDLQDLKRLVESDWVPGAQRLLDLPASALPVIWDCDFIRGPRDAAGRDTWVLCEINVSCVSPYPDSAVPAMVRAVAASSRR